MENVICKEVVITTLETRGHGGILSPIRRITQVYEKDGTLIAENDPSPETFSSNDLIHFHNWFDRNKVTPSGLNQCDMNDVYKWYESIIEKINKSL